jgi:Uma2 family endonuclease
MQVVTLPEPVPVKLTFDSGQKKLSLEGYLAFCRANPDLRVERTAEGDIIIVPPAGFESSHRGLKVAAQLDRWAVKDGRGKASDCLIDGDNETVYVYRKRHPVKTLRGVKQLADEGPAQGFVLRLSAIWKGLD